MTTIALLIAVSIYCYLIKYWVKQKYLLPFHHNSNKLRKAFFNKCIIKMESNDKFKEIGIKNCMCCYFDGVVKIGILI